MNRTWWQAGWRPCVGWICAGSFATLFIIQPITVLFYFNQIPSVETGPLVTVTMALLGLGGMRTYEKLKDITK